MVADRHIAIAGGGIAGLSAALAIAGPETAVTVYEQAKRLEEVGAGLQVSPNAWRALEAFHGGETSVADRIKPVSVTPEAIRMRRGRDARVIARIPLGETAERRWGAPYRVVHRADLQTALLDAIAEVPGITLRLATPVDGYDLTEDGLNVLLSDGAAEPADGLIGADGVWSAVRWQVSGESDPVYSGKVAWRATIPADQVPDGINPRETGLWLGRDAHLVHYGVRDGDDMNIVAIFADDWREPGWSAEGDPREVRARYAGWHRLARAVVDAPDRWLKWPLADRDPLTRWGEGPVTLAGDAAHPMLPFLAQGAAMGIEDGYVLGQALATATDIPAAFRLYENRRMNRTARVQQEARSNGQVYHLGGIMSAGRDATLGLLGPEPLLSRFDWLYGWGQSVGA